MIMLLGDFGQNIPCVLVFICWPNDKIHPWTTCPKYFFVY